MLFGEKGTVTTNKSNLNIREDDMLIFLLALLVMAVLLLKAIIPIAIVLLLIVVGIAVVCSAFKDDVDQNGTVINREFERTMGIGCVFMFPGVILWACSADGYRELLSGTLVLGGGPRPGAVILVFIGSIILIYGIVKKYKK